ncbi:MAG: MORN repeat-containing protein [Syntrophales bacterium]
MKIKMLLLIAFVICILPLHAFAECTDGNCTNGKGTMIYPEKSGMKYVGQFKNGKKEGKGTVTFSDATKSKGQKQYEGGWKEDMPSGKGTLTFFDGRKFVGEWKVETIVTQDSVEYQGEMKPASFRRYVLSAQGTMFYPNGKKEVGEFKDDEFRKK